MPALPTRPRSPWFASRLASSSTQPSARNARLRAGRFISALAVSGVSAVALQQVLHGSAIASPKPLAIIRVQAAIHLGVRISLVPLNAWIAMAIEVLDRRLHAGMKSPALNFAELWWRLIPRVRRLRGRLILGGRNSRGTRGRCGRHQRGHQNRNGKQSYSHLSSPGVLMNRDGQAESAVAFHSYHRLPQIHPVA